MSLEFAIDKAKQTNVSYLDKYAKKEKVRRERGEYFETIDPSNEDDVKQFWRHFNGGFISTNGHSAKALSAIDSAFSEPEIAGIVAELNKTRKQITALEEDASQKAAEAVVLEAALKENTELAKVDDLWRELRDKEDSAELAKIKASTAGKGVEKLESQLREAIRKSRQRRAAELKKQIDKAATEFNTESEAAYTKFWKNGGSLLPQYADLAGDGAQPGIYSMSFRMEVPDSMPIKELTACPQIEIRKNRLDFATKKIREGSQIGAFAFQKVGG